MHKQFEELCALAATGQLSGDARMLLDQHLKQCDSCRVFLEGVAPLKAHVAPVLAASHACSYELPEGIRERFLQRAASAGIALKAGPVLSVEVQDSETANAHEFRHWRDPKGRWPQNFFRFALPVAASILCGFVGYQLASHRTDTSSTAAHTLTSPTAQPDSVAVDFREVEELRREGTDARIQIEQLTADLELARQERRDLVLKLDEAAKEHAQDASLQSGYQAATLQVQKADEKINKLLADLADERTRAAAEIADARSRATTSDAVLIAQQRATDDANARVAMLEAQLEPLHDLSDKGPAAELIAARNLHIVDVYDSESNGSRSKAFGRVFYVEGKSLVFYAYDLPEKTKNKKIEFRVWGEQAGVKSVSINLGAMRSDDAGKGRWVLACNDPKLLGKINAIYIAPAVSSRPNADPNGRKMMYAFLGSANHP